MGYYTGWKLGAKERLSLLRIIRPVYPDVVAEHITHQYDIPATASAQVDLRFAKRIEAIATVDDGEGVQALIVTVNGNVRRPDNSIYHITWSIDRAAGRKSVDSNMVAVLTPWKRFPKIRVRDFEPFCAPVGTRLTNV